MILRSVALTFALSLCVLFGASAQMKFREHTLTVTNDSNVCVQFHAGGAQPRNPSDFTSTQAWKWVPPLGVLTARPGETVRFNDLRGDYVRVYAFPHPGSGCTGPVEGEPYGPYDTQQLDEHIVFRHDAFFHVAHP